MVTIISTLLKWKAKTNNNLSLNDDLKVGNSIAVNNMTYISKDGINANDKEIKNVKAVELTADGTNAATTGQVYTVRQEMATAIGGVATAVQNNARQISKLDSKSINPVPVPSPWQPYIHWITILTTNGTSRPVWYLPRF